MPEVNLFLLLPESTPVNQWMNHNAAIQDEQVLDEYVYNLNLLLSETVIEEFNGFFDGDNLENFLSDFDTLEDYYPTPARRLLYGLLQPFDNWRENQIQQNDTVYTIFGQSVSSHTFCEASQLKRNLRQDECLILNHRAHTLSPTVEVRFDYRTTSIASVSDCEAISKWFINYRKRGRNFQITVKHGENRQDVRTINNEIVSPLRCMRNEAESLLQKALGGQIRELYNYDEVREYYIIFKWEGNTPQNMYHGYHVDMSSSEVPAEFKARLLSRAKKEKEERQRLATRTKK